MPEKINLFRRTLWGLLTAGLAFAFVTLMGQQSLSSNDMSDEAKRQKLESLYDKLQADFPGILDLTSKEAMDLIADQKAIFIDIREAAEQQVSMLPGAITEKEFLDNFKSYEDHIKIAYCTISYRSGLFAEKFQHEGIPVYNLKGGILAWVHEGGKIFDRNGETNRIHVHGKDWNLAPEKYEAVW